MRRFLFIPVFFFAVVAKFSFAQPVLSLTPVIQGLTSPMQLVHAGDGSNRIFIVQKGGSILVYNKSFAFLDTFLTLRTGFNAVANERGLLSMAFHPSFANNGLFYIYYTNTAGSLELARYRVSGNANVADTNTRVIVKSILHPLSNHNGGELHFGSDGFLYLSTGDGGGGGDASNNAQNTGSLLGKILRFNVTTSDDPPYFTIPASNPFGNEIYAVGLRNPFRWNFDRLTQDMWIGDVGQESWEEINFQPANSTLGANYGWHCYEGNMTYNNTVGCSGPANYTFPVYTYPTQNPSAAITGGIVYRGNTYIDLKGYYVAADFYSGIFYKVQYDSINLFWATTQQTLAPIGISDFGETEDGELYAVSLIANAVYRVGSEGGPLGYTFTGGGNWNDPANWSNNTVPPASLGAASEIIINPAGNGECVLNVPLTVMPGGKLTVMPNKKFIINGNLVIQQE